MKRRIFHLALAVGIAGAVCASALAAAAKEQFTITSVSTGSKDGPTRVAASGPIEGRGAVVVHSSENNRVDHMTLHLAKGDVYLVAVEKTFAVHPDHAKCLATALGHGTFTITGGTRSFAGAHGSGTYIRHGVLYGARTPAGACLGRKAPIAKTTVRVIMTGAASLG